jgi:hypothetical protein
MISSQAMTLPTTSMIFDPLRRKHDDMAIPRRGAFRGANPWAAVAMLAAVGLACVGCAHQAVAPQPAGAISAVEPSAGPLVAINGDWVLLGSNSALRVSNGGVLSYRTGERRLIVQGYRIAGVRGPVVDLDAIEASNFAKYWKQLLPFAERARFLVVSDGVGVFVSPHYGLALAFRPGPVPSCLLGRYVFAKAIDDDEAIDVGPRLVGIVSAKHNEPSLSPVLAASEHFGAAATLVVATGTRKEELRIFATTDGKTEIETKNEHSVDGPFGARFDPVSSTAEPSAKADEKVAAVLPSPGSYEIEGLSELPAARIEIEGARWKVTFADDKGSLTAMATLAGQIGTRLSHVHLDPGSSKSVLHLDLRPIDGGGGAFLISIGEGRHGNGPHGTGLMFRSGAIPAWAPSFGLEKDIEMLCAELGGLSVPAHKEAIEAAVQNVGARATSDTMRSLCTSLLSVDPSMRWTMITMGFRYAGRPLPSCVGIDRLRPVGTPNQPQEE